MNCAMGILFPVPSTNCSRSGCHGDYNDNLLLVHDGDVVYKYLVCSTS